MKKQTLVIALILTSVYCYGKGNTATNELPEPVMQNSERMTSHEYTFPNGQKVTVIIYNSGLIQLFAGDSMTTLNDNAILEEVLNFILNTYNEQNDNFYNKIIFDNPWR